jgi:prolyl oligopeptidase
MVAARGVAWRMWFGMGGCHEHCCRPFAGGVALPLAYPPTRRGDVVDVKFGSSIADPYRWLENNVRSDSEVADWVFAQNAVTQRYLSSLPMRDWFSERIRQLMDFERFGIPRKAGHHYFYTRNSGLQNQAQLYVRDGLNGTPRLLLDPNTWAKDGATALDEWVPSQSGRYLLYSIQDGGSIGAVCACLMSIRASCSTILCIGSRSRNWHGWATRALYSRFPEPPKGKDFEALNYNHVYYHRGNASGPR